MTSVEVINETRGFQNPLKLKECSNFFQKFRGLMFSKTIQPDEGIILVENQDSVVSSSIHMFFMNYDLGIIWINGEMKVVDRCLAARWHPYYASQSPARFTLEVHPNRLDEFSIGDHIEFRALA